MEIRSFSECSDYKEGGSDVSLLGYRGTSVACGLEVASHTKGEDNIGVKKERK